MERMTEGGPRIEEGNALAGKIVAFGGMDLEKLSSSMIRAAVWLPRCR